jgi:hypothetical protein
MSTAGNLPPVTNTEANVTTEFFNNYFVDAAPTVSQNVNDAVVGFFQQYTGNKDTGNTLAASVIYTANTQQLDPIALVEEFRKLAPGELNAYLTMFLNFNRAGTSLLGLSNSPLTNKYIQRAILA